MVKPVYIESRKGIYAFMRCNVITFKTTTMQMMLYQFKRIFTSKNHVFDLRIRQKSFRLEAC